MQASLHSQDGYGDSFQMLSTMITGAATYQPELVRAMKLLAYASVFVAVWRDRLDMTLPLHPMVC